jgi:hypothetical protein
MTGQAQRPLSKIDRKILCVLQAEGRITNVDLAERIGMAPSPCLRHVKALEADGTIEGYSVRLDRRALGFGVLAFVQVNLALHTDEALEHFREDRHRRHRGDQPRRGPELHSGGDRQAVAAPRIGTDHLCPIPHARIRGFASRPEAVLSWRRLGSDTKQVLQIDSLKAALSAVSRCVN